MFDIQFFLSLLVGFVALPVSWFVLAFLFICLGRTTIKGSGGWSTIWAIAFIALMYTKLNAYGYSFVWSYLFYIVPCYFVAGIAWSRFDWSRVVESQRNRVIEARDSLLIEMKEPLGYFSTLNFPLNGHDLALVTELAIEFDVSSLRVREATNMVEVYMLMAPSAKRHKADIIMKIAYWPIYAVWYVVADLVTDAATWLYNKIGGWFQRASEDRFKNL